MEYHFYSSLPIEYKNELEVLFYFNKNQNIFLREIEKVVEIFGVPKLKFKNQKISIDLEKAEGSQNLFLLTEKPPAGRLLAVAIHLRNKDSADIVHIAIKEEYSLIKNANNSPMFAIVSELQRMYHQIKGVNLIKILYTNTKIKIL